MIGKLDRKIIFIQPIIETGDSNEDKITGWEQVDSVPEVWASKHEGRGNTFVQSERVVFSQTVTWMIRYRADLTIQNRLVHNQQVYEILNIAEVNNSRKRYLNVTTNILDNIYWS